MTVQAFQGASATSSCLQDPSLKQEGTKSLALTPNQRLHPAASPTLEVCTSSKQCFQPLQFHLCSFPRCTNGSNWRTFCISYATLKHFIHDKTRSLVPLHRFSQVRARCSIHSWLQNGWYSVNQTWCEWKRLETSPLCGTHRCLWTQGLGRIYRVFIIHPSFAQCVNVSSNLKSFTQQPFARFCTAGINGAPGRLLDGLKEVETDSPPSPSQCALTSPSEKWQVTWEASPTIQPSEELNWPKLDILAWLAKASILQATLQARVLAADAPPFSVTAQCCNEVKLALAVATPLPHGTFEPGIKTADLRGMV